MSSDNVISGDDIGGLPTPSPSSTSAQDCWCCTTTTILLTTIIITCLLFKFKNPFQFYIKFFIYCTTVILFSIALIPVALILRPCNTKNIEVVGRILSFLFRIFDVDIEIENSKYFQINQPYILITNHQSSLDFLTMMKIWPGGNCTPLAKKELFYSGPFGIAIWLCGITFIDRFNSQKARGTIDVLAKKINDENMRVWIFPEGTRSPKTELLPFKKGAFHLAIQAQIPIICMVTSSYLNFYSKKEKKFLPGGKVKVRVLPPFQTTGMTIDSVGQLAKHMQDIMQKEFDLLNKEIQLDEKYYEKKTNSKSNVQELDTTEYNNQSDTNITSSLIINQTEQSSQIQSDSNNNSINDEDTKKTN